MEDTLRVAVLDDWHQVAQSMGNWETLPPHVKVDFYSEPIKDEATLVSTLAPYQVLCIMRERTDFSKSVIDQLPALKLLITSGMRNAAIDLEAAKDKQIVVCGTGNSMHVTPELTMGLILMLARHLYEANQTMHNGGWLVSVGKDLNGSTLGLLGLGKQGASVAKLAQVFGMKLQAWSQNLTQARCQELGVEYVDKETLYKTSDFLSVHIKLSERSVGIVGKAELAMMKPSAYLINTSRSPIIDQAAMAEALKSGRLAGAAVDVFDEEPLPASDWLRQVPNLIMTPHSGYVTTETYQMFFTQMVENVQGYLSGSPLRVL